MIACRNCGSQMNFDIKSQQMKCMHCGTLMLVEDTDDLLHESIADVYETKVYRCTQCGAELMTQDQSSVSFCQFCGAQAILSDELKAVRKPDYIIPFTKTKEDCKKTYFKKIRWAIYAPSKMRKAQHIDEFKGIYMPYYIYNVEQSGRFDLTGTKEYRNGDYIITDNYVLNGTIRGKYSNLTHDASSNFADNISESIAPYDLGQKRFFRAGFMHGFYGDVADVSEDAYRVAVTDIANEYALHEIKLVPEFRGISIDQRKDDAALSPRLGTGITSIQSALFPVWFLSYKKHGRMSYATVNGQTGRMYADIPVEPWKYILGTILLAIPLLLLFQSTLTLTPQIMVGFCDLLALLTMFLYKNSIHRIIEKSAAVRDGDKLNSKRKRRNRFDWGMYAGLIPVIATLILMVVLRLSIEVAENQSLLMKIMVGISSGIGITYSVLGQIELNKAFEINDRIGIIANDVTYVAAAVVTLINPVDDLWYYIVCYISVGSIFLSLIALIASFNILSSRRPRTFVRRGANDNGI